MVAAPSEPAWARVATRAHVVFTTPTAPPARAGHPATGLCRGLHSYLPTGDQLCWRHELPGRFALDAELATAPVPPALGSRWSGTSEDFWRAWVTAEVIAKLTDVPVLSLISARFPATAGHGIETEVARWGEVVVCFGHRLPPS